MRGDSPKLSEVFGSWFGPVEVAHVIGRAWLRYWPVDAFGFVAP